MHFADVVKKMSAGRERNVRFAQDDYFVGEGHNAVSNVPWNAHTFTRKKGNQRGEERGGGFFCTFFFQTLRFFPFVHTDHSFALAVKHA